MTQKTIYLASPYGFSAQWKKLLLPEFISALESHGLEVWEPFDRNCKVDLSEPGWAYRVSQKNFRDVRDADALFAIINCTPPDEGVMVELGVAIALGKPIFLYRDDFRRCTDSNDYPLNLMIFAGLPKINWQAYWYESLDSILDSEKALWKWAREGVEVLNL